MGRALAAAVLHPKPLPSVIVGHSRLGIDERRRVANGALEQLRVGGTMLEVELVQVGDCLWIRSAERVFWML